MAELGRRFLMSCWQGEIVEFSLLDGVSQCRVEYAKGGTSAWLNTFEHVGLTAEHVGKQGLVIHPAGGDEIGFLMGVICTES